MAKQFRFVVYMRPVPKERPRVTTKGGATWAYTPNRTVRAENTIQDVVEGKGAWFAEHVGVKLDATFYREEPDSPKVSRLRQLCHNYGLPNLPVIEPDWDNYGKTLSDALMAVVYNNDGQVTDARIRKRYCKGNSTDPERIEFTLEEDNGE